MIAKKAAHRFGWRGMPLATEPVSCLGLAGRIPPGGNMAMKEAAGTGDGFSDDPHQNFSGWPLIKRMNVRPLFSIGRGGLPSWEECSTTFLYNVQ